MKLRSILLRAEYESFNDDFFNVFMDNVRFISNYLSWNIRRYQIETDGSYNMISISITKSLDSCCLESENVLAVKVHFDEKEMDDYLKMKDEKKRFEFYLSILEKGYDIASSYKNIAHKTLLNLHQSFRLGNYQNKRLFKSKTIKEYGIKVKLVHNLSSYDYKLMLYVYKLNNELVSEGCIYQTFPDEILFDKNVRHLVIKNGELIITDFLDHPQFICELDDLSKGIVRSICVDEDTKKYIPNEQNAEKFERLKWI